MRLYIIIHMQVYMIYNDHYMYMYMYSVHVHACISFI